MNNSLNKYGIGAALLVTILSATWYSFVSQQVPEPYLDEVFHVRQAQTYCSGDLTSWDPKITTPPGLYLVSNVLVTLLGKCDIETLRLTNGTFLALAAFELFQIAKLLNEPLQHEISVSPWYLVQLAVNISIFPPLFFFSGLYYTDVASLLFVLLSYHIFLISQSKGRKAGHILLLLVFGITALSLRQTNIFWVAIFPIGILAAQNRDATIPKRLGTEVSIQDYISTTTDIIHNLLTDFTCLKDLIIHSIPPILLLGFFTIFVLWNGGVVLGDKSNHIATIHFPQMLYIWPYILFFSFPILVPFALNRILGQKIGFWQSLPRFWIIGIAITIGIIIVRFNTIIHPFTLADNRHYVFYVFRYLRYQWLLKYVAVPIYIIGGYVALLPLQEIDIGFSIVWLISTTLSLVSAPLVEPRYFIIPWVIWRLHSSKSFSKSSSWLWAESFWFLMINIITGYIFLNRTFEWDQLPGEKQRFMW